MTIRTQASSERGVVMILMALIATVIFGFVGLSLDAGNLHWTKVRAQAAADSAAIAALREYQAGSATTQMQYAAKNDASLNGFTHGVSDTKVLINRPPLSGARAGDTSAIEAVVSRRVPSMFLRFLGYETSTVAARSVAKLGWGGGCIYALNKTAPDTLVLGGNETTVIPCDALVASSDAGAFRMMGTAELFVKNNARVGVIGGWVFDGGAMIRDYTTGAVKSPYKILSVKDPFSGRPEPSVGWLPLRSSKRQNANFSASSPPPGNSIPSGIYCGGLSIGNTGGTNYTMNGLYVMAGGGFSIGSSAKVTGTNVTIYLTSGARGAGGYGCTEPYAAFDLNGQAEAKLSAPTSGPQEGMLIFQDRTITSTADHKLTGGALSEFNGSVYLRNSQLSFAGDSSSRAYLILVADKIKIVGNSDIYADFSTLQNAAPVKSLPSLVE